MLYTNKVSHIILLSTCDFLKLCLVPKKENMEEIKKIEEIKNKKINLNLINYFYIFF